MSTSYYGLRMPITSIHVEVRGGHTHVGVWVNHAKSGTLVFQNEEWADARELFRSDRCLVHTHWGGDAVGSVVLEQCSGLQDEQQLMNEYGELTTVGELRLPRHAPGDKTP